MSLMRTCDPSSHAVRAALNALRRHLADEEAGGQLRPVHVARLHGGISLADTFLLRWRGGRSGRIRRSCVAKVLVSPEAREAAVYQHLYRHGLSGLGPRVFGVHREEGRVVLLLQHLRARRWPWADERQCRAVLEQLALLHRARLAAPAADAEWSYEQELVTRALGLVGWLSTQRRSDLSAGLRRTFPAIRRLVESLPRIRHELLCATGAVLIHGDAHPGNVLVCSRRSQALLLDWARARLGSPLEDASSWLMSLGCCEPGARRRHDTLLRTYLQASGGACVLSKELRQAYWLAGASNALAGALLHHLQSLADAERSRHDLFHAQRAAHGWMRVLRRAHAVWG